MKRTGWQKKSWGVNTSLCQSRMIYTGMCCLGREQGLLSCDCSYSGRMNVRHFSPWDTASVPLALHCRCSITAIRDAAKQVWKGRCAVCTAHWHSESPQVPFTRANPTDKASRGISFYLLSQSYIKKIHTSISSLSSVFPRHIIPPVHVNYNFTN